MVNLYLQWVRIRILLFILYVRLRVILMIVDKAIRIVLDESSPSIKYFLVKWLQEFGPFERVEKSVIAISAELGVSKDVVSKATSYLTTNGFFEKETVLTTKRWSRYSFKCSTKLQNEFNSLGDGKTSHHVALIEHLLVNDIQKRGGTDVKRHSLDLAPKLLLIILLRNANECGVVDHLGLSGLAKLTGLSKVSVKSRIEHLLKRGYIRSYISGVTGSYMFQRSPGIIYLNLKHPNYSFDKRVGATLLCYANGNIIELEAIRIYSASKVILNRYRKKSRDKRDSKFLPSNHKEIFENRLRADCNSLTFYFPCEAFLDIYLFFKDLPPYSKMEDFIQAKIEGYAAWLMSNHCNGLVSYQDDYSSTLKKIIGKEAFGDKFDQDDSTGEFPSLVQKESLVDFLFQASRSLAIRLFKQLNTIPKLSLETMNHIILPPVDPLDKNVVRNYIAIESFLKVADVYKQNRFFKIESNFIGSEKPNDEDVVNEVINITLQDEYEYGLLKAPVIKTIYVSGKAIDI